MLPLPGTAFTKILNCPNAFLSALRVLTAMPDLDHIFVQSKSSQRRSLLGRLQKGYSILLRLSGTKCRYLESPSMEECLNGDEDCKTLIRRPLKEKVSGFWPRRHRQQTRSGYRSRLLPRSLLTTALYCQVGKVRAALSTLRGSIQNKTDLAEGGSLMLHHPSYHHCQRARK